VQGDAEDDQIYGVERMARRGDLKFRRYQVRIDDETLRQLGLPTGRVTLPVALDRADAVDFLHDVGARFAASIDWSRQEGVYPPPLPDPLFDSGLWRSSAPKPRGPQRPRARKPSARLS
jgi:hypothetical protein